MLYFLQSIWLWAAAGIVVPIAIHLWNIKQGKTLKVGSIAFITAMAKSQASSLKLSQWLLLLLRCLLIVVLALLIAKPYFEQQQKDKEKGWILIAPDGLKATCNAYKPLIDSLQNSGYALHYFDKDFEAINWKDTLHNVRDTTTNSGIFYWVLLKALAEKLPDGFPVYLFTDDQLQHFTGRRPQLSLHLNWYNYPSTDTVATWLANAYQTPADSIKITIGKSNAFGTYYTYKSLAANSAGDDYTIVENNGRILVSNDALHQTVYADTSTLFISIYTNKYFADANYLKAALDAIKDFTQHKMQVIVVNNIANIPAGSDWLFWLSEDKLPSSVAKNNILVYEGGKSENIHSALITDSKAVLTANEPVALYQYIPNKAVAYTPVWKNGLDEPVLSIQDSSTNIYHFYSRFNPQWNNLVWHPAFPQLLYNLLYGEKDNVAIVMDKRMMDASQMQPSFIKEEKKNNQKVLHDQKDLSQAFWLAAFFLFLLERVIAFKQNKAVYE